MQLPIEIRRYQRGEEPAIWAIYSSATRVSVARDYHPDLIERWAPWNYDTAEWAERLVTKNPFVAIVEGELTGMAEIETDGSIDYFYVHPDWQGRGIGKALLQRVEVEARSLRNGLIQADVSVTAKGFFAAQGFVVVESKDNVILGHPAPNFRMEKRLAN